jgi:aprataxin
MQDFVSDRLKSKKHYSSFVTPFFLDVTSVIEELNSRGQLSIDRAAAEQWEKAPLQCHRCNAVQQTMPQLKQHLLQGCQ